MKLESLIRYCKKKTDLFDNDELWEKQKKHFGEIYQRLSEYKEMTDRDETSEVIKVRVATSTGTLVGECKRCKRTVEEEWDFCPKCGHPLLWSKCSLSVDTKRRAKKK